MEKREIIQSFSDKRPEAIGVYGYGSGVFRQARTDEKKTQTDVVFVVDNMAEWHKANMLENPNDYSLIGRLHFNGKSLEKIKGQNHITYFSHIKHKGYRFKYGVIEIEDFLSSLSTWENLFVAGRFQKPVLYVKTEEKMEEAIIYNRHCALIVACLFCNKLTSMIEIYNTLCSLSYLGDARMKFAENPHKVKNIVRGSLDSFKDIYPLNQDFLIHLGNDIFIVRYDLLLSKVHDLPTCLLDYLDSVGTDYQDLDMVRVNIFSYIMERNQLESKSQILEGVKTNGILRSIPYALSKVKKRFSIK